MIKRIRFGTGRSGVSADELAAGWRSAAGMCAHAPTDVRPVRIALSTALPELTELAPIHDAVGFESFTDEEHLSRFTGWLDTLEGQVAGSLIERLIQPSGPVIIATEKIVRGDDWLTRHRQDGSAALKHMAIAVRAAGLTPAEFSAAWSGHAGTVRKDQPGETLAIPAEVRGDAYVQNHPLLSGTWAYDAVNEVFFDEAGPLEQRIAWFRDNMEQSAQADLFSQSWFLAVREEILL